ncbi:MAG: hypothetical protein RLZZ290_1705 [Pseudomonadota bacterium]
MHPARRIAIVGGGWSGLACAEHLAQAGLGHLVDVFEAAPQFGGRARGLIWTSEGEQSNIPHAPIDAGQHLLLAAYTETFALLKRTDPLHNTRWSSGWLGWRSHDGKQTDSLFGLLPDLLTAVPYLRKAPAPEQTVRAWFSASQMDPRVCTLHMRPLAESALNTDWSEASALCLHRVLHDASRRGPLSLRALHPRHNLSIDGIDPLTQWLCSSGVSLYPRSRVQQLAWASDGLWRLIGPKAAVAQRYADVVLALPTSESQRMLGRSAGVEPSERRAIGTLFLHLPKGTTPYPHNQIQSFRPSAAEGCMVIGLARPPGPWGQVLSLVVSALPLDRNRQEFAHHWAVEAAALWLKGQQPLRSKWMVDRQATWAATPQAIQAQPISAAFRQFGDGRWQCADHLVFGYPATIESAVRSGRAVGEALLRTTERRGVRAPH